MAAPLPENVFLEFLKKLALHTAHSTGVPSNHLTSDFLFLVFTSQSVFILSLFVACEIPSQRKAGFLEALFGSSVSLVRVMALAKDGLSP